MWQGFIFTISLFFFTFIGVVNDLYAAQGDHYLIPKIGVMDIDANDADLLFTLGVYYGYGLSPNISLEAEIDIGISGGDYQISRKKGHYKVWTLAAFSVYRYPLLDTAYLRLKLGVLYENVTNDRPDVSHTVTSSDVAVAGGVGVGYTLINRITFEFEISKFEKNILFYGVGFHYPF